MFDDVGEEVAGRGEIFGKRRHVALSEETPAGKIFTSLQASQLKS